MENQNVPEKKRENKDSKIARGDKIDGGTTTMTRKSVDVDVVVNANNEVVIPIVASGSGNGNGNEVSTKPRRKDTIEKNRLKEEDRPKFKSLGDLHIEKGLPAVPV